MNTLLGRVLNDQFLLVTAALSWILAGHGLRRIAGFAGTLLERRWASRPGRR